MHLLLFELKLAWRRLGRRTAHTALIFSTFTLSIALALLSWSLFSAVFLQHPDFDPAGTLHVVRQATPDGRPQGRAFLPEVQAWADHQQVFAEFGPIKQPRAMLVATPEGNERLSATFLSTQALQMVRARPQLGRLFTAEEDAPGGPPAVLLSHGFWQRRYGGDPGVVGRTLMADGIATTIVGVMPASFRFPYEQDVWASVGYDPSSGRNTAPLYDVLVRLKPGVSLAQAQADLARISVAARAGIETARHELQPVVVPLNDVYLSATLRSGALVLLALSAIFVLMSCANTANLVLIDFLARAGELGTSAAIGVPRLALVRNAFWQVALLTGFATAAATGLVFLAGPAVFDLAQGDTAPYWVVLSWGPPFWLVAAGIGALSALAAAFVPALLVLSSRAEDLMRRGLSGARGSGRHGWQRGLLIGQVTLLMLLGCATGLLVKSQAHIAAIDPGFDPENVFTYRLGLASQEIQGIENRRRAFESVVEEIRRMPGIEAVGLSSAMPGVGGGAEVFYDVNPAAVAERGAPTTHLAVVTDEFFSALKLRWVAGETFPRLPGENQPDYAVITRGLAERLWPGEDALGRIVYARQRSDIRGRVRGLVVRGIVENFRSTNLLNAAEDGIYTHISKDGHLEFHLFARGAQALPAADTLRQAIRRADPRISLHSPRPLAARIESGLAMLRLTARLTVVFTVAAAVLGAMGVYSVTTALLVQRTREFGIRLTLGGTPAQLWTRFARGHFSGVLAGVAAGLATAAAASPILSALLYQVPVRDWAVFAFVGLGVVAIAGLACLPGLGRLRRINPADCLRSL